MISAELDHLVIAAATLQQGEEYVESMLGVKPVAGGRHLAQGTHNSLLKLGDNQYLEIIAIDPENNTADEVRWFDLDNPSLQQSIAQEPKLISWVARTTNMKEALAEMSYDPGMPKSASRGSLEWTFTFTPGGSLLEEGLLPALIEWKTGSHPSGSLPKTGVELLMFEAFHHSPNVIKNHLASLGLHHILEVKEANTSETRLRARFRTPKGEVALG